MGTKSAEVRKFKTYVMGWVWGLVYHDGFPMLNEKSVIKEYAKGKRMRVEEAIVFKTEEEATTDVIRWLRKNPDGFARRYKFFVRVWTYSTPDPKAAKGMPLLKGQRSFKWIHDPTGEEACGSVFGPSTEAASSEQSTPTG